MGNVCSGGSEERRKDASFETYETENDCDTLSNIYLKRRKELRKNRYDENLNETYSESIGELKAELADLRRKHEELLSYSQSMRLDRDKLKEKLEETLQHWKRDRDSREELEFERRRRTFHAKELIRLELMVDAAGVRVLNILSPATFDESFDETNDMGQCINNDTECTIYQHSEMDSYIEEVRRKKQADVYQSKRNRGFRDESLHKTMKKFVEKKKKLKRVEDPEHSRKEKIESIRIKQRLKGQGPLALKDGELEDKRSSLKPVVRRTMDRTENNTNNNKPLFAIERQKLRSSPMKNMYDNM